MCILCTKGSISGAYHFCYIATTEFFPVVVSASVFGFCHIWAVMFSILSPISAEVAEPFPMVIFCAFCVATMMGVPFLTKL